MMPKERLLYIVCILVFAAGCFYYRTKLQKISEDYEIAKIENARLASYMENESFNLETAKREIVLLKDTNVQKFRLTPSKSNVTGLVSTVYQSGRDGQVYLIVNTPFALERDKQYQLWAIQKGSWLNAGTFQAGLTGLQKMRRLSKAESFTITIEPMGKIVAPSSDPVVQTEKI